MDEIVEVVVHRRIQPQLLLASCDRALVAGLPATTDQAEDLFSAVRELNKIQRLADDSVPLLQWLALLISRLDASVAPEMGAVTEIARDVFLNVPIDSQRVHGAFGDILFPEAGSPEESSDDDPPPPALDAGLTLEQSPPLAIHPDGTLANSLSLPSLPAAAPTRGAVPVHTPTVFTLATAGAAGGAAVVLQMVLFPVGSAQVATEQHCAFMAIAAISVGALGAVYLWSVAEEIARTRARPRGRMLRYLVISLGALLGGGALSLLACGLADMSVRTGAPLSWLPLAIAGATASVSAAWSRALARPTTVLRALWTAAVAAGGTFAGYLASVPIVGLLGRVGDAPNPLLDLRREAPTVAVGAFAFVAVTQIMMSLQIHGVDALQLRSRELAVKPALTLVPRSVLPMTALCAVALGLALLVSSYSF
ncbi:MAG: hypothetical protein ABJE95_17360 [Byssovorax sp.]